MSDTRDATPQVARLLSRAAWETEQVRRIGLLDAIPIIEDTYAILIRMATR